MDAKLWARIGLILLVAAESAVGFILFVTFVSILVK